MNRPAYPCVLFVDVDGVLRPDGPFDGKLRRRCVERLNRLADSADAGIVISSTWRWIWPVARFNAVLGGRVIGITPDLAPQQEGPFPRYAEIRAYLKQDPTIQRWLALDDRSRDFPPHVIGVNVLITDGTSGLTDADVESALRLLSARP